MIRHFPFTQTYKNLAFNLKNFKPSSHRPSFKSVNHPFMPNSQLQDSSYAKWIVEASSKLPGRIIHHMKTQKKPTRKTSSLVDPYPQVGGYHGIENSSDNSGSYYYIPSDYTIDDIQKPNSISETILMAFEEGNLPKVAALLQSHKDSSPGIIIEPDLVSIIVKLTLSEIPLPDFHVSDLQVEVPMYRKHLHASQTDSLFYSFIYERIPCLYKICKTYERVMFNDRDFQEYYTWLCFHQNDRETLNLLTRAYLKQQEDCDSKVLAYAVCSHLMNYDTVTAMDIYSEILSSSKDLDSVFLESVLQSAIQFDSLFEHIQKISQMWINTNRKLSPKSAALILKVNKRYLGDEKAVNDSHILPLSQHYMVRTQLLKNRILSRYPTHSYKPILEEDIIEINEIAKNLSEKEGDIASLKNFYYQLMKFFGQRKHMNMVLFVSHKMKKDQISIDEDFVKIISKFYSRSEKFMNLLEFLEFSAQRGVPFNRQYVTDIYEGFVKTYPYYGGEFDLKYKSWAASKPEEITALDCSVISTKSSLTPFNPKVRHVLDPFKYDLNKWTYPLTDRSADSQLQYRFNQGFPELSMKGVKPDFRLIKESYENLPRNERHRILDIMKRTRTDSPKKILAVSRLNKDKYTKKYLSDFIKNEGNGLDAQNRLNISSLLMNKGLGKLSTKLLDSIKLEELNDRGYMIRLQKLLRLNIATFQLRKFVFNIDEFPINEVVLSPYIYDKCCILENLLVKQMVKQNMKMKAELMEEEKTDILTIVDSDGKLVECKLVEVPDEPMAVQMERALARLQSFIADIQLRLDSDKLEIGQKIEETFNFLNKWMKENNNDERKV
ncbi:hypothetical protein CLIB1423_12S03070 [[Candida] railenensis]|uniref:Uncharacterized protein n=1 Tax=[Candida] railenensis TaxID=45579 RepID=A0A9P0QRW2_9ASCO|nr:hypothetical protein CLIB1423_12S03070 [[Candida] railenensis]